MWTRFLTNGCPNFHNNICRNILCTRSIHRMRIFTHPAYRYWDVQYIVHCVCACAVPVHIQNIKTCALPAVSLAVLRSTTCVMCAVLWRVQCCRCLYHPVPVWCVLYCEGCNVAAALNLPQYSSAVGQPLPVRQPGQPARVNLVINLCLQNQSRHQSQTKDSFPVINLSLKSQSSHQSQLKESISSSSQPKESILTSISA